MGWGGEEGANSSKRERRAVFLLCSLNRVGRAVAPGAQFAGQTVANAAR
jgi:hypothetical protein